MIYSSILQCNVYDTAYHNTTYYTILYYIDGRVYVCVYRYTYRCVYIYIYIYICFTCHCPAQVGGDGVGHGFVIGRVSACQVQRVKRRQRTQRLHRVIGAAELGHLAAQQHHGRPGFRTGFGRGFAEAAVGARHQDHPVAQRVPGGGLERAARWRRRGRGGRGVRGPPPAAPCAGPPPVYIYLYIYIYIYIYIYTHIYAYV